MEGSSSSVTNILIIAGPASIVSHLSTPNKQSYIGILYRHGGRSKQLEGVLLVLQQ